MSLRVIYIVYFWKYATLEQIQDMCLLSTDMIGEYILSIGKEYYLIYGIVKQNKKNNIELLSKVTYNTIK